MLPAHSNARSPAVGGSPVLNNLIPILSLAKESVTGLGVPGLEAALGSTVKLLNMVDVRFLPSLRTLQRADTPPVCRR